MFALLPLSACNTEEEPTQAEKNFLNTTWLLEDITYMEFEGHVVAGQLVTEKKQLWYPSESSTFNKLCERYCNDMTITFGSTKQDGYLTATILSVDGETNFKWHGGVSNRDIDFSPSLKLSTYKDNSISQGYAAGAILNSKGKLCLNPNSNMIYIFVKT